MRNIFFSILTVLLLASFLYKQYGPPVSQEEKEKILIQTMLSRLEQLHFKPIDIDDKFSERVFDLYIKRLDGGKRFLTKNDLRELAKYRHLIDDESVKGNFEFFNWSQAIFSNAIDKTEKYFEEILSKPLQLTDEEYFETDPDKVDFAANDDELKERWRKMLEYRVITKISDKLDEQENWPADSVKSDVAQLEKEAREKTLRDFKKWFKRLRKRKRWDNLSMFLNTITNAFDPHTGYFKPIDKENFDIGMSGALEGIGARLQSDGDKTTIVSIIVGGPAWKGKELEADDIIEFVQQEGEEPVDISGWDINDVVKIIRGKKGTKVTLYVRKKDGSTKKVTIVRDLVITKESFAKSLIIKDKGGDPYGYIKLPKFYVDFNRTNGTSSAVDMAKEINKLKKAGVKGIVLDLRNNGGGSLRDVVKIAGLFIPSGPVVQIKPRYRKPRILADEDPEILFDKPLVILVNEFSASASEILAAAMQDYDRAIIVGSEATFGKGTVQSFLSLDRGVPKRVQPLGDLKLTIQKFYRINGGSTQLRGVHSDIVLPDDFAYIEKGEREMEFPLPWTQIDPVSYEKLYTIKNKKEVMHKSAQRIADNPVFAKIDENARRYKKLRDSSVVSLEFDSYRAFERVQEETSKMYEKIMTEIPDFEIHNLPEDMPEIQKDSANIQRNEDWLKSVKKDPYIFEALHIAEDIRM